MASLRIPLLTLVLAAFAGSSYVSAPPARRSVDLAPRAAAHRASPPLAIAEPRIAEPRTVAPDSSLGQLNEQSANIRCPFWRTRAYDAVESALAVLNVVELCTFVAARHKSFDPFEPLALPVRWTGPKARGLALEEVMEIVRADFDERQYYVSGELTPSVYSDRCFFDSPDPKRQAKVAYEVYTGDNSSFGCLVPFGEAWCLITRFFTPPRISA